MRAAAAAGALVLVVLVLGACGSDGEPAQPRRDPFQEIEREVDRSRGDVRAAPRWERLAVLRGSSTSAPSITVARDAIQWRARWQCRQGDFRVAVDPAPSGQATSQGRCPQRRTATFIGTGRRRLQVSASGPWRIVVEQQVETPLHEPPLAEMRRARVVARGRFRSIERPSRGEAILYALPSRRLALRFEGFRTSANSDLFVWLSAARQPRTTREVLAAPHKTLATLRSTVGEQNYLLPRGARAGTIRSIVIWCEPIRIAYAAAAL